jgi:hypothetical protein
MQNDCPVMWKTSHQKTVRWYVIGLVVVNLLFLNYIMETLVLLIN